MATKCRSGIAMILCHLQRSDRCLSRKCHVDAQVGQATFYPCFDIGGAQRKVSKIMELMDWTPLGGCCADRPKKQGRARKLCMGESAKAKRAGFMPALPTVINFEVFRCYALRLRKARMVLAPKGTRSSAPAIIVVGSGTAVSVGASRAVPYWKTTEPPRSANEKPEGVVRTNCIEFLIRGPCPVTPVLPVAVLSPAERMP